MDDTRVMSSGQATCGLNGIIQHLANWNWPLAQQLAQVLSFEQLGDDVGRTIGRAHVMHRDNVGMIEGSRRARLLLESVQALTISGERLRQYLDGDLPFQ